MTGPSPRRVRLRRRHTSGHYQLRQDRLDARLQIITVTGTQTSQDASCVAGMPGPAPCDTASFLATHFAGASTVGTYFFHYSAGDQGLTYHEWKNASADRGGDHGDIADAP